MTTEAFIYDAIRTPRGRGKSTGALHEVKPVTLVVSLLQALESRQSLDTSHVDDVVLGCVTPVGDQGACLPKAAVMAAKWHESVCGVQTNRFCGSGLDAVNLAAMKIRSGWEDLVVAGGVESMSRVPMGSDGGAWVYDPAVNLASDFVPQGISADLIATMEGFSRNDVDEFAIASHRKAARAWANTSFKKSVIPIVDQNGLCILEHDELIRKDANKDALSQLKASFATIGGYGFDAVACQKYHHVETITHIHTPGNSSGIVDGAALLLLGSEKKGQDLGLVPRGRVLATALTSTDSTLMLTGPAPASKKVLAKAGLKASDIDLFEVNEAFAAVVLKFVRDMDIDMNKVNVNGGAIAMGHPLGATGAMLVGTVLDELERRGQKLGLITLCIGGGMGIATIVERI